MFLNKLLSITRSQTNVHQLSNFFQKCTISSSATAFNNNLTKSSTLEFVDLKERKDPVANINDQIKNNQVGRTFAIVQLLGKQFKITQGDVIMLEGHWEPSNGDEIKLEKVLLCGSQDFTLIGRPMLKNGLVDVHATVIEKSLSHTRTHFKYKKRKQYRRINFQRSPTTVLRINKIEINKPISTENGQTINPNENVLF